MSAVLLGLGGCAGPREERTILALELSDATSCQPVGPIEEIRAWALGDFGSTAGAVLSFHPGDPSERFAGSVDVEALRVDARGAGWVGVGYLPFSPRAESVLVIPLERACPFADPALATPTGAMVASLGDGSLAILGGLDRRGRATGRIVTLSPSARLGDIVPFDLAVASAFGSATAVGERALVVAGGALSDTGLAYQSIERIELDAARPPGAGRLIGSLVVERREHSAIELDGEVWIVGGRTSTADDSALLSSIERVDPDTLETNLVGTMSVPRLRPALARAEDGSLWIAGGDAGATQSIERWDLSRGLAEPLLDGLPPADAVVALPGDRWFWLAGGTIRLISTTSRPLRVATWAGALPSAGRWTAVGTVSGRVLIHAEGEGGSSVWRFDPGSGRLESRTATRFAESLVRLGDESLFESGTEGSALRREDEPLPLESPAAMLFFADDESAFLLDPVESEGETRWSSGTLWRRSGVDLVARDIGARADIASLRFAHVSLEIAATDIALLVVGSDVVIELGATEVRWGDCSIVRQPGETVAFTIRPDTIRVVSTAEERRCPAKIEGRFGLAVRALATGARVRSISIARDG